MAKQISDIEKRGKIISMLFASFRQGSDAESMAMYVEMLKDIPPDVLDKACRKSIMERKYLPAIAEIVEDAKNIVGEVNGTNFLPFPDVWEEITKQLHDVFVYGEPHFSRPEIKELVDAFGWQELCEMRTSDIPIIRAQLKKMYEDICKRHAEKDMNSYIVGTAVLIDMGDGTGLMLE